MGFLTSNSQKQRDCVCLRCYQCTLLRWSSLRCCHPGIHCGLAWQTESTGSRWRCICDRNGRGSWIGQPPSALCFPFHHWLGGRPIAGARSIVYIRSRATTPTRSLDRIDWLQFLIGLSQVSCRASF